MITNDNEFFNLTEDDKNSWQKISSKVKKAKKVKRIIKNNNNTLKEKDYNIAINLSTPLETEFYKNNSFKSFNEIAIKIGNASKVSKSIVKKIKSGSYKIDASFDCHGRTANIVQLELMNFIKECHANDFKLIKIITGFGDKLFKDGVIRQNIELYINDPSLRDIIKFACWGSLKNSCYGSLLLFLSR